MCPLFRPRLFENARTREQRTWPPHPPPLPRLLEGVAAVLPSGFVFSVLALVRLEKQQIMKCPVPTRHASWLGQPCIPRWRVLLVAWHQFSRNTSDVVGLSPGRKLSFGRYRRPLGPRDWSQSR